jgi:hypothetical protein
MFFSPLIFFWFPRAHQNVGSREIYFRPRPKNSRDHFRSQIQIQVLLPPRLRRRRA